MSAQYGQLEYWEDRYSKDPEPFDWYQRYQNLKEHLSNLIKPESQILVIGAGSSLKNYLKMVLLILQAQISLKVSYQLCKINTKIKNPNLNVCKQMVDLTMDIKDMSQIKDSTFDLVLDKACLDCLFCGDNTNQNVNQALKEIHRVLKQGGKYFFVSHGMLENRLPHLEQIQWNITNTTINKPTVSISITIAAVDQERPNVHQIFICTKVIYQFSHD